jgi:hypothetical protein
MGSSKTTIREQVAILTERVNNLISRFDSFDEGLKGIVKDVRANSHSMNDLSHQVRRHQDWIDSREKREEIALQWKLGIVAEAVAIGLLLFKDYVLRLLGV